jgi:hypothetical protein
MMALLSSVLSGSVEMAVHRLSTTSSRFWLMCGRSSLIPVVGGGEWNGVGSSSGRV